MPLWVCGHQRTIYQCSGNGSFLLPCRLHVETQAARYGDEPLYQLSHLANPALHFVVVWCCCCRLVLLLLLLLSQESLTPRITYSPLQAHSVPCCLFPTSLFQCRPPELCALPLLRLRQQFQQFVWKSHQPGNGSWLTSCLAPYVPLALCSWNKSINSSERWFLAHKLGTRKSQWLYNVNCVL